MTRVDFYHIQKNDIETTLSKLMGQVVLSGKKFLLYSSDEKTIDNFDESLWSKIEESFIPHNKSDEDLSEKSPIVLSNDITKNPNDAKILVLADTSEITSDMLNDFERCLILFNGNDKTSLDFARSKFGEFKNAKMEMHYWQDTTGKWVEKQI